MLASDGFPQNEITVSAESSDVDGILREETVIEIKKRLQELRMVCDDMQESAIFLIRLTRELENAYTGADDFVITVLRLASRIAQQICDAEILADDDSVPF
jgi:hypothetical protein